MPESRLRKGFALPSPSRSSSDELRYSLARHLTDRDREIVLLIGRLRVLTTDQIARLFFDTRRRAQLRLVHLYRLGVLNRFQPYSPVGSAPYHYVLGKEGAVIFSAAEGEEVTKATIRRRAERTLALAHTQRLAHLMGVNEFYVRLGLIAKDGSASLNWLTEAEAARWTDGVVLPDAAGRWREGDALLDFVLEYDRGTEPLRRVVGKIAGYERFEIESGLSPWVLFCFVSVRRERAVRTALAGVTVPVATAVLADASPSDPIWLPASPDGAERVRLATLARLPRPQASVLRASTGGSRAWRFDRFSFDDEEAPIAIR